ncbi:DUF2470 domain-containing protein [Gordonia sp. (in: high G+C Gram-positive bacteria)]|uniref:DUF2470 domain-containing protein n=1 Tax=Gordonia sp. (in: high G+C Gram-positive bacteria) TaxID=84139 RepID=UPI003C71BD06
MNTIVAPYDAELIQTACRRAQAGTLSAGGSRESDFGGTVSDTVTMVHLFEGDAFLLVPSSSTALSLADGLADGITAMVEVVDMAPVDMRERVRALVWLSGTLHPVPDQLERELAAEIAGEHPNEQLLDIGRGLSLMRLAVNSAVLATMGGAGSVDVEAIASAKPDPFWEYEQDWLVHLESHHGDLLDHLTFRLPAHLREGRARPLRLDRFGITLRVEQGGGQEDVRIAFARPVSRIADLSAAFGALALDAAFGHDC